MSLRYRILAWVLNTEFLLLLAQLAAWVGNVDPLEDGDLVSVEGMSLTLRRRRAKGRTYFTALTASYAIRFDGDSSGWWSAIRDRETDAMLDVLQGHKTVELASAAVSEWIQKRMSAPGGAPTNQGNVPPQLDAAPWKKP